MHVAILIVKGGQSWFPGSGNILGRAHPSHFAGRQGVEWQKLGRCSECQKTPWPVGTIDQQTPIEEGKAVEQCFWPGMRPWQAVKRLLQGEIHSHSLNCRDRAGQRGKRHD